jgi:cation diffusion facilitator CzcD-associated flavoprotein CzcO
VHVKVAVIGAGFGGLGAAIRLKQHGFDDFVVLERAAALGGTWRDNVYPGCACDVPSNLYSFSFAPNPGWSSNFPAQPEIWDYLEACADRFGVRPHIRFGTDVTGAAWNEAERRWDLTTSTGDLTAEFLVSAGGPLNEPAIPKLPGLETFQGTTFHSSQWPDRSLAGQNVAVIGTGASAIQFVPEIQPEARRLTVFQRTPPWIMPRASRPLTALEKKVYGGLPAAQRLSRLGLYWGRETFAIGFLRPPFMKAAQRIARRHLERAVADPQLRAKLTPHYMMGCKRVLMSNTYYPALTQPNVALVTEPIREVRPHGVVTADGVEHPADTIIFGTGFHVSDTPIAERVRGRDGRTLAEVWAGSPKAYRGTTVAGFPNLFLLLGPNTGQGHTSAVFMIECQLAYLIDGLEQMRRHGIRTIEPRPAAQAAWVHTVDQHMKPTVWAAGCDSWYIDETGRNSSVYPGFTWRFRQQMRRFDASAYLATR